MFEAYVMKLDKDYDERIQTYTEEAANAINRLNGLDMTWERYDYIVDNIIKLDNKIHKNKYNPSLDEALNSGDGSYKP